MTGGYLCLKSFALPGNIVILLYEMVEFSDDDDVIVGSLAHGIGHVTDRHAIRAVASLRSVSVRCLTLTIVLLKNFPRLAQV